MKVYKSIILDVDGVLFDSNALKERNIGDAVEGYCSAEEKEEFVSYYIEHNGLPREVKIEKYFGRGSEDSKAILARYNELNHETLYEVPMTPGALAFLRKWSKVARIWALSGGAENEVNSLFEKNKLLKYFDRVYGGPVSKKVHVQSIPISQPCIYVGDSLVDYETSQLIKTDFAFMYEFTQVVNWKAYFKGKEDVKLIKNLEDITYKI